ncbi:MAG: hypothetical protein AAF990_17540 [Bacteroidota bacterium]
MHEYEFYLALSPNTTSIGGFLQKGIHIVMPPISGQPPITNPITSDKKLELVRADSPTVGSDANNQRIVLDLTAYVRETDDNGNTESPSDKIADVVRIKFPEDVSNINFDQYIGRLTIIILDGNGAIIGTHIITKSGDDDDPDDLIFPDMPVEFP